MPAANDQSRGSSLHNGLHCWLKLVKGATGLSKYVLHSLTDLQSLFKFNDAAVKATASAEMHKAAACRVQSSKWQVRKGRLHCFA
jgi:hypothetical protein